MASEGWAVVDLLRPIHQDADMVVLPVHDEGHLLALLNGYIERAPPSVVVVQTPNMGKLRLALGGDFASVEWFPLGTPIPSRIAVPPSPLASGSVEYIMEGHHTVYSLDHLLPAQEVVGLVQALYRHDRWPEGIRWSEVNYPTPGSAHSVQQPPQRQRVDPSSPIAEEDGLPF